MSAAKLVICCFDYCHFVIYLKGRQYSVSRIVLIQFDYHFDYPGLWCTPVNLIFFLLKIPLARARAETNMETDLENPQVLLLFSHCCEHWFVDCVLADLYGVFLLVLPCT